MQSKVAVNTALVKCSELSQNIKTFWEYDSKIELTGIKLVCHKITWNV